MTYLTIHPVKLEALPPLSSFVHEDLRIPNEIKIKAFQFDSMIRKYVNNLLFLTKQNITIFLSENADERGQT